jgi:hypothetical protein
MSNMDFFQIGALKVFADIGALIEEDEKNKIKFIDLPTDIIQNNISKYLLEDKQINKIFHNKEDNELKYILFGNNIELPYMNIYSIENKMEVKNDELMKYVNYILKQKNINKTVKKIDVTFYEKHAKGKSCFTWIEKIINLRDKENKLIAWINEVNTFGILNQRTTYLSLVLKQEDKNISQTIKKENIINECYKIHNYISECINKYYSD